VFLESLLIGATSHLFFFFLSTTTSCVMNDSQCVLQHTQRRCRHKQRPKRQRVVDNTHVTTHLSSSTCPYTSWCVAVCCSVLQCVAVCCNCNKMQHTATHQDVYGHRQHTCYNTHAAVVDNKTYNAHTLREETLTMEERERREMEERERREMEERERREMEERERRY